MEQSPLQEGLVSATQSSELVLWLPLLFQSPLGLPAGNAQAWRAQKQTVSFRTSQSAEPPLWASLQDRNNPLLHRLRLQSSLYPAVLTHVPSLQQAVGHSSSREETKQSCAGVVADSVAP